MKKITALAALIIISLTTSAQKSGDDQEGKKGFDKQRLFSGGGLTLSFSNYTTVIGASPVFGYSLTKWLDAGILFNFTYSSDRHVTYSNGGSYYYSDDKLKQTIFGPGAFARIYPVNFLFVQAQAEHNFTSAKLIPANGSGTLKEKYHATSLLLGAGYCSGREGVGSLFYYFSVSADVLKNKNSPYTEVTSSGTVNVLPIFRAGFQIPLFQGGFGGNKKY